MLMAQSFSFIFTCKYTDKLESSSHRSLANSLSSWRLQYLHHRILWIVQLFLLQCEILLIPVPLIVYRKWSPTNYYVYKPPFSIILIFLSTNRLFRFCCFNRSQVIIKTSLEGDGADSFLKLYVTYNDKHYNEIKIFIA